MVGNFQSRDLTRCASNSRKASELRPTHTRIPAKSPSCRACLQPVTVTRLIRARLKILPAGSFYTEPANVPHYIEIEEDTVLQVSGTGPGGRNLVNPNDNPHKIGDTGSMENGRGPIGPGSRTRDRTDRPRLLQKRCSLSPLRFELVFS